MQDDVLLPLPVLHLIPGVFEIHNLLADFHVHRLERFLLLVPGARADFGNRALHRLSWLPLVNKIPPLVCISASFNVKIKRSPKGSKFGMSSTLALDLETCLSSRVRELMVKFLVVENHIVRADAEFVVQDGLARFDAVDVVADRFHVT